MYKRPSAQGERDSHPLRASEDADMFYAKWMADLTFLLVPAQAIVGQFLKTVSGIPAAAEAGQLSIDQALEKARQQEKSMAAAVGGPSK